jgi:DNA repair exonuclease SbcCD ATPase subunit
MDFKTKLRELRKGAEHERYAELCALFTSGSLTDVELQELKAHLLLCKSCAELLAAYRTIAKSAMPLAAPVDQIEPAPGRKPWSVENAKKQLLNRIEAAKAMERPQPVASPLAQPKLIPDFRQRRRALMATASVALMAMLAGGTYRLGELRGSRSARMSMPTVSRNTQQAKVVPGSVVPNVLAQQLAEQSREVRRLEQELKKQMEASIESRRLLHDAQEQGSNNETIKSKLSSERDTLFQKLQETQNALASAQERLNVLQEDQSRQLLRSASLQRRLEELSTEVKENQQESQPAREALAAPDGDIRELMGARELYIADVFDVDRDGKPQKAFGRVFYTGGKSLIFYAFDLDRQAGVREASTFEAWGRRGPGDKHPLSMGAFSLDNVANRRWILRFDNPKILGQLDAVFVTVEPRAGGHKPSGKQLLFASLRIPPNHP